MINIAQRPDFSVMFGPSGPRPDDVRQAPWRRDCHLLAAAQAVAAQHPAWLASRFTPGREGCALMCYLPDKIGRPQPHQTYICFDRAREHAGRHRLLWPACLALCFAQTHGGPLALYARGSAEDSLRWILGCATSTYSLGADMRGTSEQMSYLQALYERGEALMLHSGHHVWAVVGSKMGATPALEVMNPQCPGWPLQRVCLVQPRDFGKKWHAVTFSLSPRRFARSQNNPATV